MKRIILFAFICINIFSCLAMQPVDAQGVQNAGQNLGAVGTSAGVGGDSTSVSTLVGTFINVALSMVGIIFLGLMVYAGILWMTARGEEEQVKKAQKIIYACIIGLFITVSAYAITAFITSRPEFGGSGQ